MRLLIAGFVLGLSLLAWGGMVAADDGSDDAAATLETRKADAKQVAEAWFHALSGGQTAVAASLCDVPFSFDKHSTIKTRDELRKMFDKIIENKGVRKIKPDEVAVASVTDTTVEVLVKIKDESIAITVKSGPAPRVTGFSD